jgi:hypothetical protein
MRPKLLSINIWVNTIKNMSKKKKIPAKRRHYEIIVIACPLANFYVCCIVDKEKPLSIIAVASAHLIASDAHKAAAAAIKRICQWAIKGVQITQGKPLVYPGAPATPVTQWILAIRAFIKEEVGSDLPIFEPIQPLKEEAQRCLNRKVKAAKLLEQHDKEV